MLAGAAQQSSATHNATRRLLELWLGIGLGEGEADGRGCTSWRQFWQF